MKNNRLSTRVLAVFAAVLLMMTLSIPTFAATEYVFTYDSASDRFICPSYVPEGRYRIDAYLLPVFADSIENVEVKVDTIFNVDYKTGYYGLYSIDFVNVEIYSSGALIMADGGDIELSYRDADCYSSFGINETYFGKFVLTLVDGTPSLSDYVTADTIPNVLNEIISLLPLALGVLIGFIAIRKGISYLQSFLRSS